MNKGFLSISIICLSIFCILLGYGIFGVTVDNQRTENNRLQLDNNLMVSQLYDCNNKITGLNNEIVNKNAEIDKWINIYNDSLFVNQQYKEDYWKLSQRHDDLIANYNTLNGEYNNSQVALATVTAEKAELQTQVEDLQNQIDELSADVENNQTQITDLQNQLSEKNTLIAEKDALIEDLQLELANLMDQMVEVESEKSTLNSTIQEKEQQIAELEQEQTRLQNNIASLTAERDNLYVQRDNYQNLYNDTLAQLKEYDQYAVVVNDISIIDFVEVDDTHTMTTYKLSSKEQLTTILFYKWQNLRILFVPDVKVAVDGMEVDSNMTLEIYGSNRVGSSVLIKNITNAGPLDFSSMRVYATYDCSNSSYSFADTYEITNENGEYRVYDVDAGVYFEVTGVYKDTGCLEISVVKKVSIISVTVPFILDFINMTTSGFANSLGTTFTWTGTIEVLDKKY